MFFKRPALGLFCAAFFLSSCSLLNTAKIEKLGEDMDKPSFQRISFTQLPGWENDDLKTFSSAFQNTCDRLQKRPAEVLIDTQNPEFGTVEDWRVTCNSYTKETDLKIWLETNFTPYAVSTNGQTEGLFTGYYEASLNGSSVKTDRNSIPLYKRPDDLVMVDLGRFREELKGQRIAGRVKDGRLSPYETRAEIVDPSSTVNDEDVLVWVDSAVDAFFVQIQGSGLVQLDDGTTLRIGYAGQNGHIYTAIGKILIERGEIAKEDISLQTIRAWLDANPDQADDLMNENKSYVFFRELETDGPVGGEGVPLTAERSLAIDHGLYPYGMPIWVDIEHPTEENARIQKLMMGQDTGGAIKGPVRGDFFWGYGARAEELAGKMKSRGSFYILMPNSIDLP